MNYILYEDILGLLLLVMMVSREEPNFNFMRVWSVGVVESRVSSLEISLFGGNRFEGAG